MESNIYQFATIILQLCFACSFCYGENEVCLSVRVANPSSDSQSTKFVLRLPDGISTSMVQRIGVVSITYPEIETGLSVQGIVDLAPHEIRTILLRMPSRFWLVPKARFNGLHNRIRKITPVLNTIASAEGGELAIHYLITETGLDLLGVRTVSDLVVRLDHLKFICEEIALQGLVQLEIDKRREGCEVFSKLDMSVARLESLLGVYDKSPETALLLFRDRGFEQVAMVPVVDVRLLGCQATQDGIGVSQAEKIENSHSPGLEGQDQSRNHDASD